MGINNLKFETEIFEFTQQPFRIPGISPVETKPDTTLFTQISREIAQLVVAVSQIHQVVTGNAFTRAAPVVELAGVSEAIGKLTQRLDDIESRLPKKG
jgi:hypothetical protein